MDLVLEMMKIANMRIVTPGGKFNKLILLKMYVFLII